MDQIFTWENQRAIMAALVNLPGAGFTGALLIRMRLTDQAIAKRRVQLKEAEDARRRDDTM